MYKVYCHTNKINGKKYFGITSMEPNRRFSSGYGYSSSRHFNFAIKYYGWDAFDHDILYDGLTKEQACAFEKMLIKKYNTTDARFGYNMSTGGESGAAGVKQTNETKQKRNESLNGRTVSQETRRKMSESAKGRTFSCETRKKMSDAAKGRIMSAETRRKIGDASKGRIMSEETKQKISKSHQKKKVYCEETNVVYNSIAEASKMLGLERTNICAVCRGKHLHTKGYHFKYAE